MESQQEIHIKEKIWKHLGQYLTFNINHVSHLFVRKINRELGQTGLSIQIEQFPILFLVRYSADEPLSQQDIANLLQKDKSAIQRSIRTLERDGYIRIVSDDVDRRRNLIHLTPAGKFAVDKIADLAAVINQDVTSKLTQEESETLMKLLQKVASTIEV